MNHNSAIDIIIDKHNVFFAKTAYCPPMGLCISYDIENRFEPAEADMIKAYIMERWDQHLDSISSMPTKKLYEVLGYKSQKAFESESASITIMFNHDSIITIQVTPTNPNKMNCYSVTFSGEPKEIIVETIYEIILNLYARTGFITD